MIAQSRFLGKWGRLCGLGVPGFVRGLSGDWQSYRDGGGSLVLRFLSRGLVERGVRLICQNETRRRLL